jgi:protein gp37
MAATTSIEWTMRTWGIIIGCSMISPGCIRCYAELWAKRLKAMALADIARGRNPGRKRHYIEVINDHGRWNGKVVLVPEALGDPRKWKQPKGKEPLLVFVNSMSDLFHETLPVETIRLVCEVMRDVPRHIYQVLTKRADRMRELLSGPLREFAELPNIWWGVSVENRRHGLPRIEELRRTPAAVRFLSVEPLLEDLGQINLKEIDWLIVGGESGCCPRPMDANWVRSLRDQCQNANVPFFFKQWGGRKKKAAGRELDGRTYEEMPARNDRRIPLPVL